VRWHADPGRAASQPLRERSTGEDPHTRANARPPPPPPPHTHKHQKNQHPPPPPSAAAMWPASTPWPTCWPSTRPRPQRPPCWSPRCGREGPGIGRQSSLNATRGLGDPLAARGSCCCRRRQRACGRGLRGPLLADQLMAPGCLAPSQVEDPSKYGVILLNEEGQVQDFVEKPKASRGLWCWWCGWVVGGGGGGGTTAAASGRPGGGGTHGRASG
jgi:hypothetical protein